MPSIGHTKSPSARKFLLLRIRALSVTRSIPLSCKTSRSAVDTERTCGQGPLAAQSQPGLIGLPPTVREIDAFLKDDSPIALEKVVDRVLD